MSRAVSLRADFDGPRLRAKSKDAGQSRRLLALAVIYDGGRRLGWLQIRDWVLRFKGPDGHDGKLTGKPRSSTMRSQALARLVEDGPIPANGVEHLRKDLALWIFGVWHLA